MTDQEFSEILALLERAQVRLMNARYPIPTDDDDLIRELVEALDKTTDQIP